jgi:hypothetical protein
VHTESEVMMMKEKSGVLSGSGDKDLADAMESFTEMQMDICSATDCTGLIPALPASDSEITSYEQLYHFLPGAK